jgi:hypothetical protein
VVLVKFTGGMADDRTEVLVDCVVELDIVGTPDVRIPGADWLEAVWPGAVWEEAVSPGAVWLPAD